MIFLALVLATFAGFLATAFLAAAFFWGLLALALALALVLALGFTFPGSVCLGAAGSRVSGWASGFWPSSMGDTAGGATSF